MKSASPILNGLIVLSAVVAGPRARADNPAAVCSVPDCAKVCCAKDCCAKDCCAEVVTKKDRQSCWDVECKEVCVPPVRLPWFGSCLQVCGRVRAVHVLKKHEREVDKKETQWSVKSVCCPACSQPVRACSCRLRPPN